MIGESHYFLGEKELALAAFAIGMDLPAPSSQRFYSHFLRGSIYLEQQKYSAAMADFSMSVALKPNFSNTLDATLWGAGDWKATVAALKKSTVLSNGRDGAFDWFFLAMNRWQMGQKDKARKCYDQAVQWIVKNMPNDEDLVHFRAEAADLQPEKSGDTNRK